MIKWALLILVFGVAMFLTGQMSGLGQVLQGTSSSVGGSLLTVGVPVTSTITITGAATGMGCIAAPSNGNSLLSGTMVDCYVSSANTITLRLIGFSAVTPSAQTYTVRILQ